MPLTTQCLCAPDAAGRFLPLQAPVGIDMKISQLLKNKQLSKRFLYFRPNLAENHTERYRHSAGPDFRTHIKETEGNTCISFFILPKTH